MANEGSEALTAPDARRLAVPPRRWAPTPRHTLRPGHALVLQFGRSSSPGIALIMR
jgi:hypothetical protein